MNTLKNIIENPLTRDLHSRQRLTLVENFPELSSCSHGHFLSLWRYLSGIPHQFYTNQAYSEFLSWIKSRDKKDHTQLQTYICDHALEIDRALHHLEEVNSYDWHDTFNKVDDYELIRFLDQQVHPTYLRLIEAVFCPFLKIVAYFSRTDKNKGTDGLNLWSIVKEVECHFEDTVAPYHHIIRNGIAHGGITYLEKSIQYSDKKGNKKTYDDSNVIRICDDLLDTSNALALPFFVFLFSHL